MRFTSVAYLIFLALTVVTYFVLPGVRSRATFLLLASSAFYLLLSPSSFVVLVVVAAGSYLAGLALERKIAAVPADGAQRTQPWRRALLASSIVLLIGALFIYKYLTFFGVVVSNVSPVIGGAADSLALKLIMPLGISFWTFQAIAYLVDVYRGKTPAVHNPLYFALAVTFFPIVASGPITRVQALTAQLSKRYRFDYDRMQSGLLLIGLGFFKKLLIADRLAVFVNTVFDAPGEFTAGTNGAVLLVAAVFFSIQLYCDFSGYTDIVRGSARLFGIELPINFRSPYFSTSVREFWRRWHMTLMDWFREYLYIPLGGNRKGKVRQYLNSFSVFVISGLWHGAGFTYIAWGMLNGAYVIVGQLFAPVRDKVVGFLGIDRESGVYRSVQVVVTFMLITVAWVFFRANSVHDGLYIVRNMLSLNTGPAADQSLVSQGLTAAELAVALSAIAALGIVEWLALRRDMLAALNRQHLVLRWAAYYLLILVIVIFGHYGGTYNAANFIYYKF